LLLLASGASYFELELGLHLLAVVLVLPPSHSEIITVFVAVFLLINLLFFIFLHTPLSKEAAWLLRTQGILGLILLHSFYLLLPIVQLRVVGVRPLQRSQLPRSVTSSFLLRGVLLRGHGLRVAPASLGLQVTVSCGHHVGVIVFAGDLFLKVDLVLHVGPPILGMSLRGRATTLLLGVDPFQEPRLQTLSVIVVGGGAGTCGLIEVMRGACRVLAEFRG